MSVYDIVAASAVRDYLALNQTASTSQYSDATIGSNVRAAYRYLERETKRFLADRPGQTFVFTSNGQPEIYIPGIRAATSVSWYSNPLIANVSFWLLPDAMQSGLYTGLQLRPFQGGRRDGPWWNSLGGAGTSWFDTNADSPWDPRNYGNAGGTGFVSVPNDISITGDWGIAQGTEPDDLLLAVKALASFYTLRPASILADSAITPAGGIVSYSQLPSEARTFINDWGLGVQIAIA